MMHSLIYTLVMITLIHSVFIHNADGNKSEESVWKGNFSDTVRYKFKGQKSVSVEPDNTYIKAHDDFSVIITPAKLRHRRNETLRGETCTDKEKRVSSCVQGQGECFVYVINYERKPSCHAADLFCSCNERYAGIHCEELNFDLLFPSTERFVYTGIVIIAVIGIVIVVIHIAIIVLCYRRRKNQNSRARLSNGSILTPESHTHVIADMRLNWDRRFVLDATRTQTMELKPTTV